MNYPGLTTSPHYRMNHVQTSPFVKSDAEYNVLPTSPSSMKIVTVRSSAAVDCASHQSSSTFGPTVQSPYSVMIGRAKECRDSIGNRRLEVLAMALLSKYEHAASRGDKSRIVTTLVETVHNGGGSFVKVVDGELRMATKQDAREKVGCILRNLLQDVYRSSCKNKVAARRSRRSTT